MGDLFRVHFPHHWGGPYFRQIHFESANPNAFSFANNFERTNLEQVERHNGRASRAITSTAPRDYCLPPFKRIR